MTTNGKGVRLWRNDSDGTGNYIRVQTIGTASNRAGIGTSVIAKIGTRRVRRRVRTGSSYLSSSETIITIGLGDATALDSLIVRWPSGLIDRHGLLEGGHTVLVTEGGGIEIL